MKYSININQAALARTKLDIKDGAILEYLKSFCMADDKNIKQLTLTEKGISYRYTWINFNHMIEEMPLLKIKQKASISRRIKKIKKEGFIKTFRAPDRSLYVRLLPKIKELDFGEGVTLKKQVLLKSNSTNRTIDISSKDDIDILTKDINTIDNRTMDNRTIDNKTIDKRKGSKDLKELINYFFELKEWANQSKEFYQKNKIVYARFTRPAKALLKQAGSLERAKSALDLIKDWADKNKLSWMIETALRKWFEIFPPEEDVLIPDYVKKGQEKYQKSINNKNKT